MWPLLEPIDGDNMYMYLGNTSPTSELCVKVFGVTLFFKPHQFTFDQQWQCRYMPLLEYLDTMMANSTLQSIQFC